MKKVVQEFAADNCTLLAAAISYYVLFSLFPLTLAIVSLMGFVMISPTLEAQVIESIGSLLPISSDYITTTIRGVVNARGAIGTVAIIGLIWSGTSVFSTVRRSINTAWGVRTPRSFFTSGLLRWA